MTLETTTLTQPSGVHGAHRDVPPVFGAILKAMSNPGKIIELYDLPDCPAPLHKATAAICQSLADFETPLWVDTDVAASGMAINHLRSQCGCQITVDPFDACTALLMNADALGAFKRFNIGTDERPDLSATLIIQASGLSTTQGVRLSGAGIKGKRHLAIDGLGASFWAAIAANGTYLPRGLDFIIAAGDAFVCLPRTIKVEA